MDKTEKLFKKLSADEFQQIMNTVEKILDNNVVDWDIKKLSRQKDIFRVRINKIRIIFLKANDDIEILEIMCRSEKTYKNYLWSLSLFTQLSSHPVLVLYSL